MFKRRGIEYGDQLLRQMQQGVYLFHFDISNCSQRVRICLSEKQVPWHSHRINLMMNEHSSEWFQRINPKGLVPVLVHDGHVVTESIEIIRYLDQQFGSVSLIPKEPESVLALNEILQMADDAQSAIKLLTHYFLIGPQRLVFKWTFKQFAQKHQNEELVNFRRRFINNEFTEAEVRADIQTMHELFTVLNQRLMNKHWFVNDNFSLADVAWMVNVHRMELMGFPLAEYPHLSNWYERIKQRPSFKAGLTDYEPFILKQYFNFYSKLNRRKHEQLFAAA